MMSKSKWGRTPPINENGNVIIRSVETLKKENRTRCILVSLKCYEMIQQIYIFLFCKWTCLLHRLLIAEQLFNSISSFLVNGICKDCLNEMSDHVSWWYINSSKDSTNTISSKFSAVDLWTDPLASDSYDTTDFPWKNGRLAPLDLNKLSICKKFAEQYHWHNIWPVRW